MGKGTLVMAAAVATLLWPAEIQAAHCRPGLLYRPSRGSCVTPRAFHRDVGPPRRAARRGGRRERIRMAVRERVRVVYVEREAPPRPAPDAPRTQATLSAIPFVMAGQLSLNPLPRWKTGLEGSQPLR